jgi:hypothetical protein
MVTALVKLGNVLKTPIVRVGTIFRKKFEPFVAQQTIYCRHEKIEVVSIILDDKKDLYPTKIREGIKDLVRNKKVNALWLPNDNAILNAALITGTWIPLMSKINVPLVVGVESLVKPELHFGTFAVVPDSRAAGEQAANLLYDCMNNSWHFDKTTVYPPISVYSVLNLEKAKNITKISKIKLEYVDKVLTTTDRK